MKKFSKRQIAGLLACVLFVGNKTSAMNQSEVKSLGTIGKAGEVTPDNKNLKNKISAPPKEFPKNFYPLLIALSALGLSAAVILGYLGIQKLCSKDSGDQGETLNGIFYQGLGNFVSIQELKKAWESENVFGQELLDAKSRIGQELVKLTDNKEFDEFLKRDHLQESELASIEGDKLSNEGYNSFSSYAEIRFDDKGNFECYDNKGNFECYDNKGKKLNLLKYERFFIDYIAKYTEEKLGILPCMVRYDGKHGFYFIFSTNASNQDFKKDLLVNYDKHTLLEIRFHSHIPIYKNSVDTVLLCDLEVWGKKTN